MGIISSIAGISAAAKQKKIAKRQARAAEKQAAAERERQRIEQVRADRAATLERRQQLRETRLRRAQVLAAAANAGALGASTTGGALGSLGTQFGTNIGRINEAQGFGQAISTQNEIAGAQQSEINRLEGKSRQVAARSQLIQSGIKLGEQIGSLAFGGMAGGATGMATAAFGGGNFGGGSGGGMGNIFARK